VELVADGKAAVVDGESPQEVISVTDEDEVVLYWNDNNSCKFIRELASEDSDENKEILTYYRSAC